MAITSSVTNVAVPIIVNQTMKYLYSVWHTNTKSSIIIKRSSIKKHPMQSVGLIMDPIIVAKELCYQFLLVGSRAAGEMGETVVCRIKNCRYGNKKSQLLYMKADFFCCCPTRIRTRTNRTKTCCATITP